MYLYARTYVHSCILALNCMQAISKQTRKQFHFCFVFLPFFFYGAVLAIIAINKQPCRPCGVEQDDEGNARKHFCMYMYMCMCIKCTHWVSIHTFIHTYVCTYVDVQGIDNSSLTLARQMFAYRSSSFQLMRSACPLTDERPPTAGSNERRDSKYDFTLLLLRKKRGKNTKAKNNNNKSGRELSKAYGCMI